MKKRRGDYSPGDLERYSAAWEQMMITIWQERMQLAETPEKELRPIWRTGELYRSLRGRHQSGDHSTHIEHTFRLYGVYVDRGVGRGYRHGNGGNLEFLDPAYRAAHGLGAPRRPRRWIYRKFFSSVLKMKEAVEFIFADHVEALSSDALGRGSFKIVTSKN